MIIIGGMHCSLNDDGRPWSMLGTSRVGNRSLMVALEADLEADDLMMMSVDVGIGDDPPDHD